MIPISLEINGETVEREVDPRTLLVHFIRDDLDLTGTHVGCDTGNCGASTSDSTVVLIVVSVIAWPP